MSLKSKEIEIDLNNPFLNCKLERQQYANILSKIVENYDDGFVLAINNKWGTGKTTFLKMWQQQLKNDGYNTVYFNSWENDFEDNALTAIIGELKATTTTNTKAEFNELLQKGAILAKNILPGLVKAYIARHFDLQELSELGENSTKGITEIFKEDVDVYIKRKESIFEFRNKLKEYLKDVNSEKPLIFFIDELDRCRPNYSVSVLEQIKHFFSVSGIVFVLSIDKEQLSNAVKGVYNNININTDDYLRRFIDLEYTIPPPNSTLFSKYLYEIYNFKDFFKSEERNRNSELWHDEEYFLRIAKILFKDNVTLRQQEKIFSNSRLILRCFTNSQYVFPSLFLFLVYIKIIYPIFYEEIKNKSLSVKELQARLMNTINFDNNEEYDKYEIYQIEADIVYMYYNFLTPNIPIIKMNGGEYELAVESVYEHSSNTFKSAFQDFGRMRSRTNIEYLINKIELMEAIKN